MRPEREAEDLIAMIQKLFEQIAIVRPQDSQGVLEVRAASRARRLDMFEKTLPPRL